MKNKVRQTKKVKPKRTPQEIYQVSLRLDRAQYEALQVEAARRHLSLSAYIRTTCIPVEQAS